MQIGAIDPAQHGALERGRQALHDQRIPQLAAHQFALVAPSDVYKASLLIDADGRKVVLEDDQPDVVQAQDRKGIVEDQPGDLRPVALAPGILFAN